MFAKLNHVAILSDKYAQQGLFYRALFDLKSGSILVKERVAKKLAENRDHSARRCVDQGLARRLSFTKPSPQRTTDGRI